MSIESLTEIEAAPLETAPSSAGGLVRAAAVISFGNVMSRLLAIGREAVIADLFGASGYVSIFRLASTLIQTLYDFLVGGMVSAALVPIFSEYGDRPDELWQLASIVFSAIAFLLALAVAILELAAPLLVWLLGAGYDATLQDAALQMIRWVLPATLFLGLSGVASGLLYSLKRFTYPALTTSAYNAAIILVALLLATRFGIMSLILGILVGAASQVALQLPGLRDMHYRWTLDLRHPALAQISRLYLPVLGGLAVSVVGVILDRNLASRTGDQSLAWMQAATQLYQFPLGLVATAISFAILPNLSRATTGSDFRSTLALGLKFVLLLIVPASVGLFLLASPVIALLYEHGAYTALDTRATATALQFYLFGLPFAAIDQPLVFAFYARRNTLTPNLVAVLGVAIYLVVALILIQPLGYLGLVLANSAQLTGHALVMLYLTQTRLGGIKGEGIGSTLLKMLATALLMGVVVAVAMSLRIEGDGFGPKLAHVLVPTVIALIVYGVGLKLLRVREADLLWALVRKKAVKASP